MPSPSTRGRRRPYAARMPAEQRREQLLDAALAVIARDGYGAATIDAIAREAGVTRPVVYGSFERLGDLLGALLDRQQERAVAQLAAAMPSPLELLGPRGLELAVGRLVGMVREDPGTWRPILVARRDAPAVVQERIEEDRRRWVGQTAQLVQLALGRPEEEAEVVAEALLAICEHFGQELIEHPERFSDGQLVRLAGTLMAGFRRG